MLRTVCSGLNREQEASVENALERREQPTPWPLEKKESGQVR